MERKIGEIFNYDGEWYQTVKSQGKCMSCDFMIDGHCIVDFSSNGSCFYCHRKDKENVIFKKLEKVGEPFPCRNMSSGRYGIMVQWYKVFVEPILTDDSALSWYNSIDETILIALNNKEDMEKEKHSNSESIGKNLKPFDLQSAKSGKPVCTRDGRKARIICFDQKDIAPIVGLVTGLDGKESIYAFYKDGRVSSQEERVDDLMMLSEKKEGWVNLYRDEESKRVYCGESIFSEREKAEKHYEYNDTKVATVSIGWEE